MKKMINTFLLLVFIKFIATTSALPFLVQGEAAVYGLSISDEEEVHSQPCKKNSEELKEVKYIPFYNLYKLKQLHGQNPVAYRNIDKFTKELLIKEIPLPPPDLA